MKTVLHIFLKDMRQMRWTLALWLVLLAVQLNSALSNKQALLSDWWLPTAGPHLPVWTVFHWLGLVVVAFQVLLADRAMGIGPFWKSRPITRGQMATAKFLFLAAFTVLLPVAVELAAWRGQGISWRQTLGNAWLPLLGQAYVVSCMALVAMFCGRRMWEVIVLAVFALVAPLALGTLYGSTFHWWGKIPTIDATWRVMWESPPDYLMPSDLFILSAIFAMGLLPAVALTLAGLQAYLRQRRASILQWLAVLLVIWLTTPPALLMYRINTGKPQRDGPVHRFTVSEARLMTLEWIETPGAPPRPPWSGLRAKLRLPELPTAGPHTVMEAGYGLTRLILQRSVHGDARGYQPHFLLPDERPRGFDHRASLPDADGILNRSLTRTNGPLVAALGQLTVLNPVTPDNEPRATMLWLASRSLTNFTHGTPQWRVMVLESEARIVGRQPFSEYRRQHPITNAEPAEATSDPRYTIVLETKNLGLAEQTGGVVDNWDTLTPRKVVLWHPRRRELLLPTTSQTNTEGNHGVLALSSLMPLDVTSYANQFPHTAKGKEPQPGAPGPEWFAEAELLLLALKSVTTRSHIIEVPNMPLPPVEVKP